MREFLIKTFDREEYAQRFLLEGEMKFSHVALFQELEDGEIREDKNEGLAIEQKIISLDHTTKRVIIKSKDSERNYIVDWDAVKKVYPILNQEGKKDIQFRLTYIVDWLIYCITYINSETSNIEAVLQNCNSFGSFCVVICDCSDFLNKVKQTFPNCEYGFVRYSETAERSPFVKSKKYELQQE